MFTSFKISVINLRDQNTLVDMSWKGRKGL